MEPEIRSVGGVSRDAVERLHLLEVENDQLHHALESRIIIEQAKGAISVRCGVDPEQAFALLRGLARSQRREIHEFAAEVVANRGRIDHAPRREKHEAGSA